ncbi:MAG: hypothetical protein LBR94_01805, partial [Desulfovibrio sp.]|nr:hypothetical protein [Desulfovibrio sp.]
MSFWGLFDGIASTDALTESRVLEAGADATAAGLEPKHPHAMSEEEYRASEWYDKRIPYAPNMT